MAKAAAETQLWLLIEDNEWEGERWKVWFEAPAALEDALDELKDLLWRYETDVYSLRQVDELPDSYDDGVSGECAYAKDLEDGKEGCDDYDYCDYCRGTDGYFAPESQGELNGDILTEALEYYRSEGWNSESNSPLYKLGLFN